MAPYYASSRLILPEVVGEDEQLVAQGSAFVQVVNQITQLGGPILGGLLIALISAPAVLLIDAASYAFSFVVILRVRPRGQDGRAGARPRAASSPACATSYAITLLGPMMAAAAFINFVAQALIAMLPVLVVHRFDANPKIVGFFFAAFGAGALIGSLIAAKLVRKVPLPEAFRRLAILVHGRAAVATRDHLPWPVVVAVLAAFGVCAPLVNAPILGLLTVRTPAALRPKVMTAVMTISDRDRPARLPRRRPVAAVRRDDGACSSRSPPASPSARSAFSAAVSAERRPGKRKPTRFQRASSQPSCPAELRADWVPAEAAGHERLLRPAVDLRAGRVLPAPARTAASARASFGTRLRASAASPRRGAHWSV